MLEHRRFGRVWGDGVYATWDQVVLAAYLRLHGAQADALELVVNVSRVLTANVDSSRPDSPLFQILRRVPDGMAAFVLASVRGRGPHEAFLEVLINEGYDALEVNERGFSPRVGGSPLVIFDPRRVVVVDGE
jgi:hypothetical protein